jgi:hypothetical protein
MFPVFPGMECTKWAKWRQAAAAELVGLCPRMRVANDARSHPQGCAFAASGHVILSGERGY